MDFLKKHWTWAVGIVAGLWLLSKLVGSSKTTAVGANVTTPSGVAVSYGGTNANDAAVQVAQLQAQNTLAQTQISGNLAVEQAKIAAQANLDTQNANVDVAGIQAANALAISNGNNAVAMRVSDNGLTLGLAQAQYSSATAIAQAGYGAAASIAQTNADVTLGLNYNATQLAAYGIQSQVANHQTDALTQIAVAQSSANRDVQLAYLGDQAQVINNQSQLIADTYALERSGQLNKGGEGGVNQVAVWNSLTNPGSAAAGDAAAASTAVASASQISGIISSLGGAVGTTLSGITGLVKAVPA